MSEEGTPGPQGVSNINTALVIQATQGGFSDNTGFGVGALANNADDNSVSAFGFHALNANTSGTLNSAFGNQALASNVGGANNSAFGTYSLQANTTGSGNSAFGYDSFYSDISGSNNCIFGALTLNSAIAGNRNCAIGYATGHLLLTGADNVLLGYLAGNAYTGAESNNIIVGSQNAFASDGGTVGESNVTRIGPVVARNNQQVGQGWPGIYTAYNYGSQNGALTAQGSYTPPAVAGSYVVKANVYCTIGTTTSFSVKVNYHDLNGTAHSDILPLVSAVAPGVFLLNGLVVVAGTYYAMPIMISVDNSQTPITFSTVGTFTTVTYFLNAEVEQVI